LQKLFKQKKVISLFRLSLSLTKKKEKRAHAHTRGQKYITTRRCNSLASKEGETSFQKEEVVVVVVVVVVVAVLIVARCRKNERTITRQQRREQRQWHSEVFARENIGRHARRL
jgi:hypothetical protein